MHEGEEKMYRVLIADPVSDKGLAVFAGATDISLDVKTGLSEDELVAIIGEYDALIVRSQTRVTTRVLDAAERLKVIGRAGVGVDNVDVPAATARGIIVLNAPDGNTISTAEHTWALLMSCARWIPQACATMRDGKWDRKSFTGVEISRKTLGIVGFGRIGGQVARRALAFQMRVLVYDPYLSEDRAKELGVEVASLDTVVAEADFITVHTPLTPETRHIIGAEQFARMKPGVRVINCARGGIIDEGALVAALEAGKVAAAALDVWETEPPQDYALACHPKVVATPHLGASTVEAQENVAVDVAAEVIKALRNEAFKNAVNIPSLAPEALAKVKPFLTLAESVGRVQGQLLTGRVRKIEVAFAGTLAGLEVSPLTNNVVKGLLDTILSEAVNAVNAQYLAKERGIKIAEVKEADSEDYGNLIRLTVTTDQGEAVVAGSLLGRNEPRIVQIDGYHLDVVAAGYLLVTRHEDKPGMIGKVGTILGNSEVNIANMQVGRTTAGGPAVMVLGVDNEVPGTIMAQLRAVPGVSDARLVRV
jgi:D-3-phosphoglycerate dehydrogenase